MFVEFNDRRASDYENAMNASPHARAAELHAARWAFAQRGRTPLSRIVELGAGAGYATSLALEHLAPSGELIACDPSPHMLERLKPMPGLRKLAATPDQIDLPNDSTDLVFSMASFHHVPNKSVVLNEIKRILKPGGDILIIDVEFGTPVQRFFDHVVRRHCRTGHEVEFLDIDFVRLLSQRAQLEFRWSHCKATPWRFDNESTALHYVAHLLGLELDLNTLRTLIDRWLNPIRHDNGAFTIPWCLGLHLMSKRDA